MNFIPTLKRFFLSKKSNNSIQGKDLFHFLTCYKVIITVYNEKNQINRYIVRN